MQLRYRGISYQYNLPQVFPLAVVDCQQDAQSKITLQLRTLHYRGICHLLTVVHLPEPSPKIVTVSVGYLGYRLYCLGWRSRLHQSLPQFQHWLLSTLLYYRRGFTDAAQWAEE